MKKESIGKSIVKFESLIDEFSVAVSSNAPSIQMQDFAVAQAKPDKPRKMRILILTFLLSSLFSVLLIFTLERKGQK